MAFGRINLAGDLVFAPLMKSMFGGGAPAQTAAPPRPRVVRMPTSSDPSVLAAGTRARQNLQRGRGRLSTILTDMTRGTMTGSGGKLGQ